MSSPPSNPALAAGLILVTIAGVGMLAAAQVIEPIDDVLTVAGALAAVLGILGAAAGAAVAARATGETFPGMVWQATKTALRWLFVLTP